MQLTPPEVRVNAGAPDFFHYPTKVELCYRQLRLYLPFMFSAIRMRPLTIPELFNILLIDRQLFLRYTDIEAWFSASWMSELAIFGTTAIADDVPYCPNMG